MEFNIRNIIEEVEQFKQNRTEVISVKLQSHLQKLCESSDKNVFDPNSSTGKELFLSLHELMSFIKPNSGLMWSAIQTLEEAIKHPAAQQALIHTFKFTPIFTKLLENEYTTNDIRIQVLRILQSCTYGTRIHWQEAYLKTLISLLIKWTTSSGIDNNLISLSLGVLVNLCFNNNPPIINMIRCSIIDDKKLLNTLAQHRYNLNIIVKACRLIFILREMQGRLPDCEILLSIKLVLEWFQESFKSRKRRSLKHPVDNLRDEHNNVIHQCFTEDINILLKLLGSNSLEFVMKCTGHLLVFLQALIDLDSPEKELGYYRILEIALTLAGVDNRISRCTLHLVRAILIFSKIDSTIESNYFLLDALKDYLKIVLSIVSDRAKSLSDYRSWMVDLLSLLLECRNTLQQTISSSFDTSVIKDMFVKDDSSRWSCENLFDPTLNELYIKSFALVSSLSKTSQAWNDLLDDLKKSKILPIRFAVAAVLYTKGKEMESLVLQLLQQMKDSSFYKNVMRAKYCWIISYLGLYSKL